MNPRFNKRALRVRQARFGQWLAGKKSQVVAVLALLLGVSGSWFIWQGQVGGYSLLALALSLVMLVLWYRWGIKDLAALDPASSAPDTGVDSLIAPDCLALAAKAINPQHLWQVLASKWQWKFLVTRLRLNAPLIEEHLSQKADDLEAIWILAIELARSLKLPAVTAGCLSAALVLSLGNIEAYLTQIELSKSDIAGAVFWQQRLEEMMQKIQQKSTFGGMARDWAFGFTPLLNRYGTNISRQIEKGLNQHIRFDLHESSIGQIIEVLAGNKPSLALVGEVGVGKTTLVYGLAERLLKGEAAGLLAYHQVYSLNPSLLISNSPGRGELESLMLGLLREAQRAQNIIIFLDDAPLFFSDETGSVNLTNILLPLIESASVPLIMAMNPNDWQVLGAKSPALAALLSRQVIREPEPEVSLLAMQDQVFLIEAQNQTTITWQAIKEAYRLSERYLSEQAFPGKGISLLNAAVHFAREGLVTQESVQSAVETMLGVKVTTADQPEKKRLLNLEAELHKRMVNQDSAVRAVADALRRARAGVGSPSRPIGSFLFLGPTGVGKTELSKALAAVYFGGSDRMTRLDMTEYSTADSVGRLLAPVGSANNFLARIRTQPFGVVLFDEVEKAHTDILNLLLQLLEEGRLTDTDGHEVSFKDSIIIATSNAGAADIRSRIEQGQSLEQFGTQFINSLIDQEKFLPELINRFDEVVLFRPLKSEELSQIVRLMIKEVNASLEPQRVSVKLTAAATEWLVKNGNDPRLGARPLRRLIQRSVENVVAKRLLGGSARPGSTIELDVTDLEIGR